MDTLFRNTAVFIVIIVSYNIEKKKSDKKRGKTQILCYSSNERDFILSTVDLVFPSHFVVCKELIIKI